MFSLFEISEKGLYLVATDGHKLAILHNSTIKSDSQINLIMPREFIDQLSKIIDKKELFADVAIVNDQFSINYKNNYYQVKAIDGHYPDFRRIVPESLNHELSHYNFEYLADFNKAMRLINNLGNSHQVILQHNGNKPAIVDLLLHNEEWQSIGLIMPLRHDNIMNYENKPLWIDYQVKNELEKVA